MSRPGEKKGTIEYLYTSTVFEAIVIVFQSKRDFSHYRLNGRPITVFFIVNVSHLCLLSDNIVKVANKAFLLGGIAKEMSAQTTERMHLTKVLNVSLSTASLAGKKAKADRIIVLCRSVVTEHFRFKAGHWNDN